ncbi:facilitated trehalose transporter tret1-2 -like protein [Holotrichia oblita]|uniref:Facilitated trehalose transporter tret1-2 -like protein n=1 Tax=Holotrichia oblita TaxID=644536 RepID=A0ACB9TPS9_HOLOL|nr:facilitated trehalose transporter tret1-2 -like protein [Holotrichia oblita]
MTKNPIIRSAKNLIKTDIKKEDLMQIFALMSASLSTFTFGALFAWTSPSIPQLLSPQYNITSEQISYLTIVGPLSMCLWSPVFCKLMDTFGRKYTLLSTSVLHVTAWLLIAFAKDVYYIYMISRFISGMADACCMAVVPTYVAEVTKPRIRDLFGSWIMIWLFFGQFIVNVVGNFCDIRMTALIMLCIPILFIITFSFMPESPYYCCMKGEYTSAKTNLQFLHRKNDVEKELTQLVSDVKRQLSERGTFKDLILIPSNRRALIIANLTRSLQQLSGFTAMLTYAQYIFQESTDSISSGAASMLFNALLAICCIFGNIVADKVGKPVALSISGAGSGLSMLAVTLYAYFDMYTETDVTIANYVPIIGLVLYVVFFSIGLAMIPTALVGELFSTSIKSKAAMITNMVFAAYIAGMNKLFQYLMDGYGLCVPFLLFTICCFIAAIASYIFVPNTKGKSLEEIQQILKGNKI